MSDNNHSIYCPKCHVLLLKAAVCYGEVKCHKCRQLIDIKFVSQFALQKILPGVEAAPDIVQT